MPALVNSPNKVAGTSSQDHQQLSSSLPIQFCQESSLHGLRFIGHQNKHPIEKLFWASAFFIAVGLASFSIQQIWKKYTQTPIITIFKPVETPISLISFPAITICNSNSVIKEKADALIRKSKQEVSDAATFHKLYMMEQICSGTSTVSEMYDFLGNQGKLPADVREKVFSYKEKFGFPTQNQSISDFIVEVTDECHDMILLCLWNGEKQNCKDIFQSIVTDFGRCCSFNMIPTNLLLTDSFTESMNNSVEVQEWDSLQLNTDKIILPDEYLETKLPKPRYPLRQNRPGRSSGLTVFLNPNMDSYYCASLDSAGFMTLAHSSLQFPRMSGEATAIIPGYETFLQLKADVTLAAPEISGFMPHERNCYFGDEFSLRFYKYYTLANCEDECLANFTFNECGCVYHYMPRNISMDVCGPGTTECAEDITRKVIQRGVKTTCQVCLPSCTDVQYLASVSYLPLRNDVDLWTFSNGSSTSWAKENVSILNVYFSGDSTYPKLRTKLYGPLELISSMGGLLGLCLGFSVLSLLEIFYFLTFRLYFNWQNVRDFAKRIQVKVAEKINVITKNKYPIWHSKVNPGVDFDWKYTEHELMSKKEGMENNLSIKYDKLNDNFDKHLNLPFPTGLQL